MGHRKPNETTKDWLESAPLPSYGESYTVVSHKEVMDGVTSSLKKGGFTITRELYRANLNAKIAQGIYHLAHAESDVDTDMGMMFAWTNSYDKSTKFQCGIGAQVFVCNNGLIHGDLSTYGRKHTGSANEEIASSIVAQIGMANNKFKTLVKDKDTMKTHNLSITAQSELLGRLFVEEKLIDSQQIGIVKSEIEKPSFNYGVDPDTAWMFYNNVTHAFKQTHPRNWMNYQSKFHKFMMGEVYSAHTPQIKDTATKEPDVVVKENDEMPIEAMDSIFDEFKI
jgi:hypothetical protein